MVASSGLAQVINYSCSISYRPGPQDQILSRPRAAVIGLHGSMLGSSEGPLGESKPL